MVLSAYVKKNGEDKPPSLDVDFPLNLTCLDGFRCLACMAVVFYHVHFVHGVLFFLSTESCLRYLRHLPILGNLFFEVSWHMTAFWLISGFLCERQLHRRMARRSSQQTQHNHGHPHRINPVGTKESFLLIASHMVNRLMRLYPVYFLMNMLTYLSHKDRPELRGPDMVRYRCDLSGLMAASTFTMDFSKVGLLCVGQGWTLQNDIHGHLALAFLFVLTHQRTYNATLGVMKQKRYLLYKQLFLWTCYAGSLYQMLSTRPYANQRLDGQALERYNQSARLGIDHFGDRDMIAFGLHTFGLDNIIRQGERHLPIVQEIRDFRLYSIFATYFTGIGKHGSALLLGSLLYTKLYERQGKPSRTVWKLVAAALVLVSTQGHYIYSGLPVYWILDVLLTFRQSASWVSALVHQFLSNRVFQAIVPYTFGIYMYHLAFLFIRMNTTAPLRIAAVQAGQDACHALWTYGLTFVFQCAMETFFVAFIIAFVSRWTYEYPFHWVRKRYSC